MISAVLERMSSVSLWAERSISSARPRISAEYAVMAEHSSAMLWVSPWVPAALVLMAEVLPAISSRAAESCSVRPERFWTLPLEVRVRWRTSPTTPLMRSELSLRVPMASRMGVSTYLRIIRKAAATRKIPTTRVKALVTREMM